MLEMKKLYEEAKAIQEQLVADRRYLHQIPELSMDLPKTTAYVCQRLDEIGVTYERLVGGVVATIGKSGGKGIPTVKPWDVNTLQEKFALVRDSGSFAVAMDIDAAGLPFLQNWPLKLRRAIPRPS